MSSWVPGGIEYKEWVQAKNLTEDITSAIETQTQEISRKMGLYLPDIGEIKEINEKGFSNVVDAVNGVGAAISFKLGLIHQELEIHTDLLTSIFQSIKYTIKAKVIENYEDGCRLVRESQLGLAIQRFERALELDNSEFFCNLHLGLLYLNGKTEDMNVIDLEKAEKYLLTAYELGKGKASLNKDFLPMVAHVALYVSLCYYFQVKVKQSPQLAKAIQYANLAIKFNNQLASAYYFLAIYFAFDGVGENFLEILEKACVLENTYYFEIRSDQAFREYQSEVIQLSDKFINPLQEKANSIINETKENLAGAKNSDIKETIFEEEIVSIMDSINSVSTNFSSGSYQNYVDSYKTIESNLDRSKKLIDEISKYFNELQNLKNKKVGQIFFTSLSFALFGLLFGWVIAIPACICYSIMDGKVGTISYSIPLTLGTVGLIIGFILEKGNFEKDYWNHYYSVRKNLKSNSNSHPNEPSK